MQETAGESTFQQVPWTAREAWIGVAGALALIVAGSLAWVVLAPEPLGGDVAVSAAVVEPLAIPIVWLLGPGRHGGGWRALGLRPVARNALGLGCGALAAIYIVSALNTICVSLLRIPFEPSVVTVVANTRSPVWLAAAAVFVAPISEELLFRGFAFAGLQRRYGWVRGALFSSLAFAVIHLQPAMILAYIGIGFLLALLYYWTNSLWPCVAVHAAVNGIGILAASYLASQLPAP